MPVVLVVEDGSGKANSNSYDTCANCIAYAANRGITLPPDPSSNGQVATWLIKGTDYLESFYAQYVGQPTTTAQALSWPRNSVAYGSMYTTGNLFPNNAIPPQLIAALDQLVIAQFQGINLMPNTDYSSGGFVIEEKVDVLITKYSEKIGTTSQPVLPAVMALLRQLLVPISALQTVRV